MEEEEQEEENPWLRISAEDYEAHMAAIGQADALRDIFRRAYEDVRPRHLAILGCSTGGGIELVDSLVTETVVGVDINPGYLQIASSRLGRLGQALTLIHGDVMQVELPVARYDLIHVALLMEYVDAAALLRRVRDWLAPGGVCCLVTQSPVADIAPVSHTPYASLRSLAGRLTLRSPAEIAGLAAEAELQAASVGIVKLQGGKSFAVSTFVKASAPGL